MSEANVKIHVNGRAVTVPAADADMSLAEYLHERMDLTGTKVCCGIGACRACTVGLRSSRDALMEKTLACVTPVSAVANQHIYTVESLADGNRLSPLQQTFLESFAFQCGYCTPGFLMAASAMLEHVKAYRISADQLEAEIDTWVGGNLCRCTGYVKYREAIRKVALVQMKSGG
ncbi:(2Fe-2S)-binding protein [Paraburkholderia silvatlantica]|uniref:Aerobic-type carbon monoxide dehydrogenase small subunit (CoxS/CutS family) n=1 Tax=Paraburkholderia silvatlantica TaxID=321895 RepID=A0A2U1AJ14_9BURK|nr:2Fe-2S iron-sulfur cluster-binding protein [Paraburkholderia silvatlantica]MBB2927627.1 aerobic-type carbon monoxide dehydrogenase small subunit (CoxS/CutS family) [Paraburkholderia silvatlantica]PVY36337.1 aerobic-type carbon monoxide dehydrogenase small subunit (CoxS/CutS family) [Paraburkholderia silvatlantica]PXW40246.1 aerobic-type carbon monoxide dehydrogenase small subunit (CoxS/CutS family) [Paraburkholderia silvatlantica]PYE24207.1 aerobic-type carbon monoxide dehydrogenase small su